ncbi:MAG: hypothetical protein FJ217_09105 [Ignavibacteria bacterium]|nr:hypothetical protein [Ignavibacteria bacterium]
MRKYLSYLFTAIVVIGGVPVQTPAQNDYVLGGLAGAPTRMGFGARGIGLANAFSAVRSDEISGYYNPALVPFQPHPSVMLAVGFLPLDRKLNFASYTQSLRPSGGFSIGIINAGVSDIEGRNRDGAITETHSTSENAFLLSFGITVAEQVAVGVSAKIFYYSLFEDVRSATVGFDFGFVYSLDEQLTIAGALHDINSKYKWDTSQLYGREGNITVDRFPLRRKIALGYAPKFLSAILSGEIEWVGSTWLGRIGTEIQLHERFTLRGGVDQISFAGEIDAKPAFGFSVRAPIETMKPVLHYSYVIEPYVTGGIHMISLNLNIE